MIYDYLDKNLYSTARVTVKKSLTKSTNTNTVSFTVTYPPSTPVNPSNIVTGNIAGNLSVVGGFIQSNNFVRNTIGWRLGADGTIEAVNTILSGQIIATSGAVGGWAITSNAIKDTAGTVGLSSAVTGADDIRFWAGNTTPASAPFSVTEAGVLKATSGTIGGWAINATTLSSTGVILDSANQRIESGNYVSGVNGVGFRLDKDQLEVGSISARGVLKSVAFQKSTISTIGGSLLLLDGDILAEDMSALDSTNTVDYYPDSSANITIINSVTQCKGQSFTNTTECTLLSCQFDMWKAGLPTGNVLCKIYSHTGTYGTSSLPGTLLATSEIAAAASFTAGNNYGYTFTFPLSERITLEANTYYVVVLECTGGDGSNYIAVVIDATSPAHSGNAVRTYADTINFESTLLYDLKFKVLSTTANMVTKGNTKFVPGDILRISDGINEEWMQVKTNDVVIDSFKRSTVTTIGSYSSIPDGLTAEEDGRYGQTFSVTNTVNLSRVQVYLKRTANRNLISGYGYVDIYAHTGTYGTDGTPTGAVLATSDSVLLTSLNTYLSMVDFHFSTPITLTGGNKYCWVFRCTQPLSNEAAISIGYHSRNSGNNLAHAGNAFIYDGGSWFADQTNDMVFAAYANTLDTTSTSSYFVYRDLYRQSVANENPIWKKGATIVNYGRSGNGGIYMTASDSTAPYIDVFDHNITTAWNGSGELLASGTATTRVRIGNLNGFLGYSGDAYGIAIGDATNFLKYDPTNGLRMSGKIDVSSTGYILGGQTAYNTGTGFYLGYSGSDYKFSIGNPASNYMTWDGTTLELSGKLLVRTVSSDPQHATPASRPSGTVKELVYYSGKLYFCTNSATPTWEKITSS